MYTRRRILLLTGALGVSVTAILASLHTDGLLRSVLVVTAAAVVPVAGLAQSVPRALRERRQARG